MWLGRAAAWAGSVLFRHDTALVCEEWLQTSSECVPGDPFSSESQLRFQVCALCAFHPEPRMHLCVCLFVCLFIYLGGKDPSGARGAGQAADAGASPGFLGSPGSVSGTHRSPRGSDSQEAPLVSSLGSCKQEVEQGPCPPRSPFPSEAGLCLHKGACPSPPTGRFGEKCSCKFPFFFSSFLQRGEQWGLFSI